jgi:DNA-binding NtrC family response regulator
VNTPRLLLVDDQELLGRGLGQELAQLHWQVRTASNAEDALLELRKHEFDALVLDLQAPAPRANQILAELARVLAPPVAVLLSGALDVATTVRAIQDGASDVLEMPISAHDLDTRLRTLLRARSAATVRGAQNGSANSELQKILGETAGMRAAREQMQIAARYPELYLTIVGESGSCKELVAEAIHSLGATAGKYLSVRLATIPDHLIETELFGSEGEGEQTRRIGLFELAGEGTLFFTELIDLPPHLHPKVLRALETRAFRRLGGDEDLPLQARVIAATRRRTASTEYTDLQERLGAFTILLPPLRSRLPDIELVAGHVLSEIAARTGKPPQVLSEAALEALVRHSWRGNVRELELVLREAVAVADGEPLTAQAVRSAIREHGMPQESDAAGERASGTFSTSPGPVSEPLRTLERRMITDAWQISGQNLSAAARSLGLPRTTLRDRLKKYGLR